MQLGDDQWVRVGELAARSGVSVRALRYYEQQGLLAPQRSAAGQRLYSSEDARSVAAIRELFSAGFCSSVIAALLPAIMCPEEDSDTIVSAFASARARLHDERAAIERELKVLDQLQRRLGIAPDVHVRAQSEQHEHTEPAAPAAFDHRDRRLR